MRPDRHIKQEKIQPKTTLELKFLGFRFQYKGKTNSKYTFR